MNYNPPFRIYLYSNVAFDRANNLYGYLMRFTGKIKPAVTFEEEKMYTYHRLGSAISCGMKCIEKYDVQGFDVEDCRGNVVFTHYPVREKSFYL